MADYTEDEMLDEFARNLREGGYVRVRVRTDAGRQALIAAMLERGVTLQHLSVSVVEDELPS